MLDTLLNNASLAETLNLSSVMIILITALGSGFWISFVYRFNQKIQSEDQRSLLTSLVILPVIIAMLILLIGNNVARAFSLAGAFGLIRFRSTPGDAKDISYVFLSLAVGLACGLGYIAYGLVLTVVMSVVLIMMKLLRFDEVKVRSHSLRISCPEDLDYQDVFDKVLSKYTKSYELERVRTIDFGSLFELNYRIELDQSVSSKAFVDELRIYNGNLPIVLSYDQRMNG